LAGTPKTRTPEVIFPFGGLIYVVLVLLYVIVSLNFPPFSVIFVPFIILYLASAYGVWKRNRWGYLASTIGSAVFLILQGPNTVGALSAVTIPSEFLSVVTAFPVLLATFVYSVVGTRQVWNKAKPPAAPRMIPRSSIVILLVLGFIVGGVAVGLIAAGTETRLLASSGGGDITIVQGAGNPNNPQFFSPASFTVKVGTAVTWVNKDGTTHTVTSKTGLFDSGNFATGDTFKFTFTQAGSYQYYCTIHPWMTGTIVVTSS
jgi:plastocyanin